MSSSTVYEIRRAILAAAARIEREPSCYSFGALGVPACGTVGCMWGWIGFELGVAQDRCNIAVAKHIGVDTTRHLYDFCLAQDHRGYFQRDPAAAANALRKYADRYFPAPKAERNFARELMANLPAERIPDEVQS